ncbi:Phospholipid methyltransferase [Penicillium sp. IBT 16267x]|nr:Phospholipid methyltransferase [Penicillium sp. IBT 16267x]
MLSHVSTPTGGCRNGTTLFKPQSASPQPIISLSRPRKLLYFISNEPAMAQLDTTLLGVAMVLAIYLINICATPPNPSPPQKDPQIRDHLGILLGPGIRITMMRYAAVFCFMSHALITILPVYAPERMAQVCPNAENRNPAIFVWSTTTTLALAMIYFGAAIRIMAYGGLGRLFTFHLAPPDRLITSGVYRWIQHPSYSGLLLIIVATFMLFFRWDGVFACWIPGSTLATLAGWGISTITTAVSFGVFLLALRMRDEEEMLKHKFGKEWEEWHATTRRIIPGIL